MFNASATRLAPVRHRVAVLVATLAAAILAGPSVAQAAYPGCIATADQQHTALVHPGQSVTQHVTFTAATGVSYEGDVFRPATGFGSAPGLGAAPTAAIMHGKGANPCAIWWLDRLLAGQGWIVVDVYRVATPGATAIMQVKKHIAALRAAVLYLRSPGFPYAANVDAKRLVLLGHSLGSAAVSVLQGQIPDVQAAVALDNLHKWGSGDPGAYITCVGHRQLLTKPTVAALGFASDKKCIAPTAPPITHETKLPGYKWWRFNKKPVVELVMKDFGHGDFTTAGTDSDLERVAHFVLPWLDCYVPGLDPMATACSQILAPVASVQFGMMPNEPIKSWLSLFFHSASYFSPTDQCSDLRSCL